MQGSWGSLMVGSGFFFFFFLNDLLYCNQPGYYPLCGQRKHLQVQDTDVDEIALQRRLEQ